MVKYDLQIVPDDWLKNASAKDEWIALYDGPAWRATAQAGTIPAVRSAGSLPGDLGEIHKMSDILSNPAERFWTSADGLVTASVGVRSRHNGQIERLSAFGLARASRCDARALAGQLRPRNRLLALNCIRLNGPDLSKSDNGIVIETSSMNPAKFDRESFGQNGHSVPEAAPSASSHVV